MFGKANEINDRLSPVYFNRIANNMFPTTDPTVTEEPIHEICSTVTGPLWSGVSAAWSTGMDGDIQPRQLPWQKLMMFTII